MAKRTVPYLIERGGRYWARVVIPAELRPLFGKRELRHALGPNLRSAMRMLPVHTSRFHEQIAAARDTGEAPAASLPALAQEHYAAALELDERSRSDSRVVAVGMNDLYRDELRDVAAGRLGDQGIAAVIGPMIESYRRRGIKVDLGTPEWRDLARTVAAVELEVLRRMYERDEGDMTGQPALPILKASTAKADAVSIMKLLDVYLDEREKLGRGAEARKRWSPAFRQLVEFLGHDDATKLTHEKVEEWLAHALRTKSAKTVRNTDLAAFRTIFKWALMRRRVPSNPFADIVLSAPREVRGREKGLTDEEAVALLKASRAYEPQTRKATPQSIAAKRWVPILIAYTGARIAEITQLRREDVREQDGVTFIRITPEAGSVKTDAYRDVPLHEHLIELGFVDFVRAAPAGPLFYRLGRRKAGALHPARTVSQDIGKWIRGLGVLGEVAPNHGWRHRFKTVGRELGIEGSVLDAIQGHAPRTAGEGYGHVTLKTKAAAIARMPRYAIN